MPAQCENRACPIWWRRARICFSHGCVEVFCNSRSYPKRPLFVDGLRWQPSQRPANVKERKKVADRPASFHERASRSSRGFDGKEPPTERATSHAEPTQLAPPFFPSERRGGFLRRSLGHQRKSRGPANIACMGGQRHDDGNRAQMALRLGAGRNYGRWCNGKLGRERLPPRQRNGCLCGVSWWRVSTTSDGRPEQGHS